MARVIMPARTQEKILINDIPLTATHGELCQICSWAHKIMQSIAAKDDTKAFYLAKDILEHTDAIIERQVDKEAIMRLIDGESG